MDIKALLHTLLAFFKKLNRRQKIVFYVSIVVFVGFLSYVVLFNFNAKDPAYGVLFEGLDTNDSALIIQHLKQKEIPYKISKEDTILIPKSEVYEERIALSIEGIPRSSKVGFEIFDKKDFGSTEFDQKVKLSRALEGELARTIEALSPIKKALVHIALPEKTLFVSHETPPSASVVLHLRPNMRLSTSQINGIKNLISSAIPKLKAENVSIVDQDGEPLGVDNEDAYGRERANSQLKYKQNYERLLEDKIINILVPIIGDKDGVVAKVSVDFDFSEIKSTQEIFDPNNVVRSEQNLEEKRQGAKEKDIGGVPGAVSNIGPVQGLDDLENKELYEKSQSTTNYEISKTISEIKGAFGSIKRLSAAVIVDGKYKKIIDEDGERLEYIALSQEQLEQIQELVKQAIAYQEARGDSVSVSNFELHAKSDKVIKTSILQKVNLLLFPLIPLLKYVIVAIIIFVFYKKVISPFANKMTEVVPADDLEVDSLLSVSDDEESANRISELKKKAQDQLGLGDFNEEEIRYEVLLERIKTMISDKPEEIASLFQTLVHDELGIEDKM